MGDKTQIGLFSLALKYQIRSVLLGALAAFALMTFLAVVVGQAIVKIIPKSTIELIAALLFIGLGLFFVFGKNGDEEGKTKKGNPFLTSFLLVASAELGDKTQLLVAALAIQYASPLLVFSASFTGLALASLAGIALVPLIKDKISWLEKAAGLVLVLVGVFMLFNLR